jgi:hypothetical protein
VAGSTPQIQVGRASCRTLKCGGCFCTGNKEPRWSVTREGARRILKDAVVWVTMIMMGWVRCECLLTMRSAKGNGADARVAVHASCGWGWLSPQQPYR